MKVKLEKLLIKRLPERNPFVVLAMNRKAGSHQKSEKAIRRSEKVNVLKMDRLDNRIIFGIYIENIY